MKFWANGKRAEWQLMLPTVREMRVQNIIIIIIIISSSII